MNPVIELNGFSGRATFGGVTLNLFDNASRGIEVTNETNQTNALFLGNFGFSVPYFSRTGSGGSVSFLNNKHYVPKPALGAGADGGSGHCKDVGVHHLDAPADAYREADVYHRPARRRDRRSTVSSEPALRGDGRAYQTSNLYDRRQPGRRRDQP